jgi:DNA-binding protein H-NS
MATTLSELMARKESLEREIRDVRLTEKAKAVAQVRALMATHGLTASDVDQGTTMQRGVGKSKVPPKFRDPETGVTWSGRGLKPKWLSAALGNGKTLADFAI